MAQPVATIPLSVSLRQSTVDALSASVQDISLSEWLSTRCRQWIENFRDGGLMLSPDQVSKIQEVAAKPIANGNDVVSAIGKTRGNADGQRTFLLSLDPTFVGPLQVRADEMGRTPEDLINDMFSMALDNNWAMSLDAAYQPPVFFPHFKIVQTLTGLDRPTGAEIEKAISELVRVAQAARKSMAEPAAEPAETVG